MVSSCIETSSVNPKELSMEDLALGLRLCKPRLSRYKLIVRKPWAGEGQSGCKYLCSHGAVSFLKEKEQMHKQWI